MGTYYVLVMFIFTTVSKKTDKQKSDFCSSVKCDDWSDLQVCGIRAVGEGFRLKLFKNECELLQYGCRVDDDDAYGIINLEYCDKTFSIDSNQKLNFENIGGLNEEVNKDNECASTCTLTTNKENVCAITKYETGFKIRLFNNKCELTVHNCKVNGTFIETDLFLCEKAFNNITRTLKSAALKTDIDDVTSIDDTIPKIIKNLVIVDTNMLGHRNDINETIETFFAATHVLDLPMREVSPDLVNVITRRRHVNIAGPVKVFQPWTTIPANVSDHYMYGPTLSSCYHKCPTKCPDTYAPVCGVPGIVAREPSLMFQNHCFMDVAQCKMRWEEKSPTAISSSYIESSFMFCLGDQLNAMYRFLPLVRTLQHMGRLKKKGRFRYKLRNMRFFNSLLSRDPKLMG